MEIIYHIKTDLNQSLKDIIKNDDSFTEDYGFRIIYTRKKGRVRGWSSIRYKDSSIHGAIKLEWLHGESILKCRVVTRNNNNPIPLYKRFEKYLRDNFDNNILDIMRHK